MITPTRASTLAARANQERLASYVTHCGWCSGPASGPKTTTGICDSCRTQLEAETMMERDEFENYCKRQGVPENLTDGLTRYVYDRIAPGAFLTAVLENHPVLEVIRHADADSVAALKGIYVVLHNEVPMGWYGSALSVEDHLMGRHAAA